MLLKRKSEDLLEGGLAAAANTGWPRRSHINEQRQTPTLHVEVAQEITILPYSYFQEARFYRNGETWEVVLYWPSVIVTVKGQNLEKMVRLTAEQSLASLEFRPAVKQPVSDDLPEFESITVTPRTASPSPLPPVETKPQAGPKNVHRQCYSVV
jgi:hypothetical protein